MKRYRVFSLDLDSRPFFLSVDIQESWEENVKSLHRENKERLTQELLAEFGTLSAGRKKQDFEDLGSLPISILAFHNKFLHQIRTAFVMGSYYPALTASCTLGERILNHLILLLREDFSGTPEYKGVFNKDSFDNWSLPIEVLEAWKVLLPKASESFRKLWKVRKEAVHFKPEIDENDRALALKAIHLLYEIVGEQFSGFGPQPWFITGIPGECYLKSEVESQPFIKKVYCPKCFLVGPYHKIEYRNNQFIIYDISEYENRNITDEEFVTLRKQGLEKQRQQNT